MKLKHNGNDVTDLYCNASGPSHSPGRFGGYHERPRVCLDSPRLDLHRITLKKSKILKKKLTQFENTIYYGPSVLHKRVCSFIVGLLSGS